MPLTYRLDPPILRISPKGDVDYTSGMEVQKEAMRKAREITQSSDGTIWDVLFDIRESKESRSEDQLQGIAMSLVQNTDILTGRMAMVVTDPAYVEKAEMFIAFAEKLGHKPRIFGTPEEAEAWLAKSA